MNIGRMNKLADKLDTVSDLVSDRDTWPSSGEHPMRWFHMRYFSSETHVNGECGTLGCVAGWACALFLDEVPLEDVEILDKAETVLGLNAEQSTALFTPGEREGVTDYGPVTARDAAKAVRKAAAGCPTEDWWR